MFFKVIMGFLRWLANGNFYFEMVVLKMNFLYAQVCNFELIWSFGIFLVTS